MRLVDKNQVYGRSTEVAKEIERKGIKAEHKAASSRAKEAAAAALGRQLKLSPQSFTEPLPPQFCLAAALAAA